MRINVIEIWRLLVCLVLVSQAVEQTSTKSLLASIVYLTMLVFPLALRRYKSQNSLTGFMHTGEEKWTKTKTI
ncbi:hypothetical protein JD969_08825 [Planctomycetota bacterium]|nr:hypothetical protein JD969_08825 [Planctomycetota bacterium]